MTPPRSASGPASGKHAGSPSRASDGPQGLSGVAAQPPQGGAASGPAEPAPRRPLEADSSDARRCGLVAIVGRPNVGKSTLLNALVGQKISITSRKAQTTRHRITGIRTLGPTQFVFVDTPGFQMKHGTALHRTLNRTVLSSLSEVDAVLFVVEAGRFGPDDAKVLALLPPGKPALLIANKLDAVKRRQELLPWLKSMQEHHAFAEFVPMSAQKDADVQRLFEILAPHLPLGPWLHEEDALTDRSDRFLASEIIREKLFRLTGDELPYSSTVVIDQFEEIDDARGSAFPNPPEDAPAPASSSRARPRGRLCRIAATIIVERDAHKGMVVGQGGERLKRIGSEARQELEQLLGARVFLEMWVKVRSGWADDEAHLRSFGYE
ncbi:MAG: GTPase Era [Rubrivivax sp.]